MSSPLDPLLAPEPAASDESNELAVELPGHDQPDWLWPVLVVAFASLIAWLAIFGPEPTDSIAGDTSLPADSVSEPPAATGAPDVDVVASDPATDGDNELGDAPATDPSVDDAADPPVDGVDVEAGVVDPVGDAERTEGAAGPRDVVADLDVPAPGFARLDGVDHPIAHSCVGITPLAPASTADVVSTHLLAAADGVTPAAPIIERWFAADGTDGIRVDGVDADSVGGSLDVDARVDDGPAGSFAGEIELADGSVLAVALNPPAEGDERLACADAVVTNEPAQFAFPFTRPVVTVCRTGDPEADGRVVAVLIEGARMLASPNGDGSHTLRLVTVETALTPALDLVDPAGELFVDGDRLGYSGLVSDGTTSFDLTFDVDTEGALACPADGV